MLNRVVAPLAYPVPPSYGCKDWRVLMTSGAKSVTKSKALVRPPTSPPIHYPVEEKLGGRTSEVHPWRLASAHACMCALVHECSWA